MEEIKARLGIKAAGRRVENQDDICVLRENLEPYNAVFDQKNEALRLENGFLWDKS